MERTARCKFTVTKVAPAYPDAPEGDLEVQLDTQYDAELSNEDRAFSTATPWGEMKFGVQNPALAGFFEEGKSYYVDISPAEAE